MNEPPRPAGLPLELSPAQFRELADSVVAALAEHLASLPELPAQGRIDGVAFARELARAPAPESPGTSLGASDAPAAVVRFLLDEVVPRSFTTTGPGFVAYVPGGGLPTAALGEWIAAAVNRYTGTFPGAPALAQLEANVLRWFAEWVGFPATARGFLTSGGSLATWSALVTARRERLPEDFLRGVIYTSDQGHHAIQKAAMLAGFPVRAVRQLAVDGAYRLRPEAVAAAVAADRRAGLQPFCLVASAGTTNTGAVDPLPALADLARAEGLWFHVDAAYGGFFTLTERGRQRLAGLERADSVVLDPHKTLFLPYGTGALLVRDGAALARAHHVGADYMPTLEHDPTGDFDPAAADFQALSPELSRPYRGLSVWLPLTLHGVAAFRRELDEKLDLAAWAAGEVAAMAHVQLVAPPELSIFAFRLAPPGISGAALDALNSAWLERTVARGRLFLSSTRLDGRVTLRLAIVSFRTHHERLEAGLADLRAAAAEVLASHR